MTKNRRIDKTKIIPCSIQPEMIARIEAYTDALIAIAPSIGTHGLSHDAFWRAGIFHSAVEKIRGSNAASMKEKKAFIEDILGQLKLSGRISDFDFTGAGDRHDYQVILNDGRVSIIEAKGCLDGNNTTVYTRPANADEFIIWSLCQNPGADPKHNVWSGVHTRLGGKIIAEKERVDALIVFDQLCGGLGRPCPKIGLEKVVEVNSQRIPPPCIYLFPRTIPDPRNNTSPAVWKLHEIGLVKALIDEFSGSIDDVTEVHIEARMNGANVERKTTLKRCNVVQVESGWTVLKRASR
jgi:hypothetical protein